MTAVVVFNPKNIPVTEKGTIYGAGEWVFVQDIQNVSNSIAKGDLVIANAPEDPVRINERAQGAFEQLRNHFAKVSEQSNRKSRNNKSQSTTGNTEGE